MLIYGICYYYGVNEIKNIINHVNAFNNIKNQMKLLADKTDHKFPKIVIENE